MLELYYSSYSSNYYMSTKYVMALNELSQDQFFEVLIPSSTNLDRISGFSIKYLTADVAPLISPLSTTKAFIVSTMYSIEPITLPTTTAQPQAIASKGGYEKLSILLIFIKISQDAYMWGIWLKGRFSKNRSMFQDESGFPELLTNHISQSKFFTAA